MKVVFVIRQQCVWFENYLITHLHTLEIVLRSNVYHYGIHTSRETVGRCLQSIHSRTRYFNFLTSSAWPFMVQMVTQKKLKSVSFIEILVRFCKTMLGIYIGTISYGRWRQFWNSFKRQKSRAKFRDYVMVSISHVRNCTPQYACLPYLKICKIICTKWEEA